MSTAAPHSGWQEPPLPGLRTGFWGSPRPRTAGSDKDAAPAAARPLSPPALAATPSAARAAGGRGPGLPGAGQSRARMQMRLLIGPRPRLRLAGRSNPWTGPARGRSRAPPLHAALRVLPCPLH